MNEHETTKHDEAGQSVDVDLSRRDWVGLLGAVGGAFGLAALSGCANQVGGPEEATGTTSEALNGTTNINWVDTVASLRALAGGANWVAILERYAAVGDGGGGLFVWSTTAAADDGGTILNSGGLGSSSAGWRRIYSGPLSVRWFGAVGNGTADDTAAFKNAVAAAANGTLFIPPPQANGSYVLTLAAFPGAISIIAPIHIVSDGAKITVAGTSYGYLFNLGGSNGTTDITIDGLWFDATGSSNPKGVVLYSSGTPLRRIQIRRCRFTNLGQLSAADDSSTVCSAIWLNTAQQVVIEDNAFGDTSAQTVQGPSGFGAGLVFCQIVRIQGNTFNNTGWASIHLGGGNSKCEILDNVITGTMANTRNEGGSIELQGASGPDTNILIRGNYVSGYVKYGNAIRIGSSAGVDVEGNVFDQIQNVDSVVSVAIRTTPTVQPPWNNITIRGNLFIAYGAGTQTGVYALGDTTNPSNQGVCQGLIIADNQFRTPDGNNYFSGAVWVHGQYSGIRDVSIHDNMAVGKPAGSPVVGMIGLVGMNAAGLVTDVTVHNNILEFFLVPGGGASNGNQVGVMVNQYCNRVSVRDNTIKNFYYGIYTYTNAGPVLKHLRDNDFVGSVSKDLNLAVEEYFGAAPIVPVTMVTSTSYLVAPEDSVVLYGAGGAGTVTLPYATCAGRQVVIKNLAAATLTVAARSGNTIDGVATKSVAGGYHSLTVVSDGGSSWYLAATT
jgi:hypothetical protein